MDISDAPTPAELAVIQAKLNEFIAAGLIKIIEYDAVKDAGELRFHPAWFRLMCAGRQDLIGRAFAAAGDDLLTARRLIEWDASRLWPDADTKADPRG